MIDNQYEEINRKLETLLKYQKGLAAEIKKTKKQDEELLEEIEKINNRILVLEHQVSLLNKKSSPELINYKAFTPSEIAEMKNKMSWSEMSRYLKCSVTTCQRLVRKGKEMKRNG